MRYPSRTGFPLDAWMADDGLVTSTWTISRCRDRLTRLAGTHQDAASFRQETIGELKRVVGFDGWCWSSTDPLTGVTITGLADNPALTGKVRQLFELEYDAGDVNAYRDLARHSGTGRLFAATGGNPERSRRWAQLLGPSGVGDELRAVQDHLRGVFRKLAVTDRHQLTARLLNRPPGPASEAATPRSYLMTSEQPTPE